MPEGLPRGLAVGRTPLLCGAHLSASPSVWRVEARSSAFLSVDASESFDNVDDVAAPPRFLPWCRSAQEETRAVNYLLNGSMIALVLTASATELLELVKGDFFSAHASVDGVRTALNQSWEAYAHGVDAHPLATKAVISGAVYGAGDFTAQTYEQRSLREFDFARTLRSALCGLLAHGPLSHLYYEKLDRFFILSPYFDGGDAWYTPLFKIAVDQTAWSVTWNSLYYILLGLMKLESPAVIISTVRASWWDVLKAGWRLWPIAHLVTYFVVPCAHRVLWVDTVELVWVTILAHYGHQQRERAAALARAALNELAGGSNGMSAPGQVACALPGASFTEEILRSIDGAETDYIVFSLRDGDVALLRAAEAAMRTWHATTADDHKGEGPRVERDVEAAAACHAQVGDLWEQ
ncbi:hypothetical protein WJX81_001525 [Elliptochloris bilobata]|uniref:Uncharacterized protein n=1 Tax=Elliptochloris bilobata TaxID=381761 RepID=A0AAW1RP03_9CHLO